MRDIKTEDIPDCIACGGRGEVLYEGLCDVRYGIKGSFGMKRCDACGLLWLSPRVVKEDVHEYYARFFTHPPVAQNEVRSAAGFLDRLKDAVREIVLCGYYGYRHLHQKHFFCFLGKFLGYFRYFRGKATRDFEDVFLSHKNDCKDRLLIDVGCGEGAYLGMMKELGWGVLGIEPHEDGCRMLEKKGISFIKGTLEDARQLPDGVADQITLIHVLEHVYDPGFVIQECFRLLKKGGRLIVRVPNAQSLAHKLFKMSCYHLDPPRHIFSFSVFSLRLLFKKSPFETFSLMTSSFGARSVYDSTRIIARTGRCSAAGVERQQGRFLFFLLESLLVFLRQPVGEEIRVAAVK